ncbi:MAG: nitrilase-related carbon-nitrogen hydrolase [Fidelibacterota bacterium]
MVNSKIVKIALVQQFATPDIEVNINRGLEAVDRAAAAGAKLVAFAELAFTPFYPQHRDSGPLLDLAETIPGKTTELFADKAREHGLVLVLNLFEKEDEQTYDTSPVIDADGSLLGVTRMMHIADYTCFYEKDYYTPGNRQAPVYETAVGKVGVAICYDRHFPEYMRLLGIQGAELVIIPQAGTVGEWPPGLYEAELQVAAFQNGYFCALVNRVGREAELEFAGESFITNPRGVVLSRAPQEEETILMAEVNLEEVSTSPAREMFFRDRRPGEYDIQ